MPGPTTHSLSKNLWFRVPVPARLRQKVGRREIKFSLATTDLRSPKSARADLVSEPGAWITYAIHDPNRPDDIGGTADGLVIYGGESKEFGKLVRTRMRNAGTATRKPTDRIDGTCYAPPS
jgi:hypothetical protein